MPNSVKNEEITLISPHENLLNILREVAELNSHLSEGRFVDDEKGLIKSRDRLIANQLSIQIAARSRDIIPSENIEEITRLIMEIAHRCFYEWHEDIVKFLVSHGTTLNQIENFLNDQEDAEEWTVVQKCECGKTHIYNSRKMQQRSSMLESLSGIIIIP